MSLHDAESPQALNTRKRHLEEDDDNDTDLPPNKRQKRRLQKNRESAARSREKKARLFKEMQVQVSELTEKNNQLTRTLALLTNQCESMNSIRDENRDLRDKLHKLELQIAKSEMENRHLRSQCGGGSSRSSPPPIVTQQTDSTPSRVSEDDGNQAAVSFPPITTSNAMNSLVSKFPPPNIPSLPHHDGNQPPTPPMHSTLENGEERSIEELTQLLLHSRPQNGLCTTSVPSCLPVHLYTCANTNNIKPPPKYYNPNGPMPSPDCLARSRGQFDAFNASLPLQPPNGFAPPGQQPGQTPPFPPWPDFS